MNFTHFLITRFNLRNFQSTLPEKEKWIAWTYERISIFKKYCLPSVLNQSNINFQWLIYFDIETPDSFTPFLEDLKSLPFIHICYCNGTDDFYTNYMSEVIKRSNPKTPWIITSQLDNDDILHQQVIETIQKEFVAKNNYMISLSSGYVLDLDKKIMAHYFYPTSPFISRIENIKSIPTGIFEKPHTKWPQLKLAISKEFYYKFVSPRNKLTSFILDKPMWIQIVHGKNVSNSFFRGLPVTSEKNLADFSLSLTTKKLNPKTIIHFANYVIWKRYIKSSIVRILNS